MHIASPQNKLEHFQFEQSEVGKLGVDDGIAPRNELQGSPQNTKSPGGQFYTDPSPTEDWKEKE